jgi:hypothetical protein
MSYILLLAWNEFSQKKIGDRRPTQQYEGKRKEKE